MSKRFSDKVVIITGAASGLGKATAILLAKEGAKLSIVDIDVKSLEEVKSEILDIKPEAEILQVEADVSDENAVKNYVGKTVETYGKIDGFFNNAGIEGNQNITEDYGIDEFDKVISINLNGVFYGMKYVLEVMKEQGRGSIVNSASVGGIRGIGSQSGYAASKHGVVGLTKNACVEYGEFGVRINSIAPGAILTPMVKGSLKQIDPDNWEEVGEEFVQANPMKRFGKPEEVAHLVAFLLSDESPFINGSVINIDGGQSNKY